MLRPLVTKETGYPGATGSGSKLLLSWAGAALGKDSLSLTPLVTSQDLGRMEARAYAVPYQQRAPSTQLHLSWHLKLSVDGGWVGEFLFWKVSCLTHLGTHQQSALAPRNGVVLYDKDATAQLCLHLAETWTGS